MTTKGVNCGQSTSSHWMIHLNNNKLQKGLRVSQCQKGFIIYKRPMCHKRIKGYLMRSNLSTYLQIYQPTTILTHLMRHEKYYRIFVSYF